jgi:transcriptional regulator with XRE-family HTH domain
VPVVTDKAILQAGDIRKFREKHHLSQGDLADKLGISAPQVSQIESGKAKWRSLYGYALRGLEPQLTVRKPLKFAPPLKVPPHNREGIRCPHILADLTRCGRIMYGLNQSRDPRTGTPIYRMFCKGARKAPHASTYVWVDGSGQLCGNPPRSRRRHLAPFETREGPATCTECGYMLQWQEEFRNRWGYAKLYSFRCINPPCTLFRKRVYRDPDGRPAYRDPRRRRGQPLPAWANSCPAPSCKGLLWRSGSREKGRLTRLLCRRGLKEAKKHEQNDIRLPIVFYYRPGRRELLVHGLKRRSDGRRELMTVSRWVAEQLNRLSPASFFERMQGRWFTLDQFAKATTLHRETARQRLLDSQRAGELVIRLSTKRKRSYRYAASPTLPAQTEQEHTKLSTGVGG